MMLKVNAIGDNCPIPVIKQKKAMQEVNGKETIEVWLTMKSQFRM